MLVRNNKRNKPTHFVEEIEELNEDDEDEYEEENEEEYNEVETRHKIRKIKDDDQLKKSTKAALKREQDRIKRLEQKKKASLSQSLLFSACHTL